jgi:PleD family two-component response regulator
LELARLAHSLEHRRDMPIVLLTPTESDRAAQTSALKAGVNEWVTKTPDMLAVSNAIRRLLES